MWTLPLDTVEVVWQTLFPSLLRRIREGEEPSETLEKPDLLKEYLNRRLSPIAYQLHPGIRVVAAAEVRHTFVVHDQGLMLPNPLVPESGPPDYEGVIAQHFGAAPAWFMLGRQIDTFCVSIPLAILQLWREYSDENGYPTGNFDLKRYEALIWTVCGSTGDAPTTPPPLHFRLPEELKLNVPDIGEVSYLNRTDGAGYFTAEGYYLRVPAPIPSKPRSGLEQPAAFMEVTASEEEVPTFSWCTTSRQETATDCCG
ncbi:MAG TPA: hypothetical protein VD948_07790 [Rhodothermales bacterium]|nr:hypothetical protein [Rhodothermales bacterium]